MLARVPSDRFQRSTQTVVYRLAIFPLADGNHLEALRRILLSLCTGQW
jgi:hypothetical protein